MLAAFPCGARGKKRLVLPAVDPLQKKYRPPRPTGREGRMFPPEQFKKL